MVVTSSWTNRIAGPALSGQTGCSVATPLKGGRTACSGVPNPDRVPSITGHPLTGISGMAWKPALGLVGINGGRTGC